PKGSQMSILAMKMDANDDGVMDWFSPDRSGQPVPVPAFLDPDGDGIVTEKDAAYLGYYWGETTFEELWIPLPAPDWD
ncbi:MAG: hypothetical protein HRF49_05925, partial [bacterium]